MKDKTVTSHEKINASAEDPNVQAFLAMLRYGEGTSGEDGYRTMFTGKLFSSFDKHPNQLNVAGSLKSTAAGAYQFLFSTWDGLVKQYGFKDFSPESQTLGAIALILGRKALDDVIAGRFEDAVKKCALEWASLPGSPYGQPVISMKKARSLYEAAGGKYGPSSETKLPPVEDRSTYPQETTMSPFVIPAFTAILEAIPKLGAIFSSGSQVAERNVAAAEAVVNIAKTAISATNEQDLVEKLQSDPSAVTAVQQAVEQNWFEIHQKAEESRAAAREFVTEYVQAKDVRTVLGNLTFPELLTMVFVIISAIGAGIVLLQGDYSAEIKGSVITLMLVAGYTGVREFWFGSSPIEQSAAKKQGVGPGV